MKKILLIIVLLLSIPVANANDDRCERYNKYVTFTAETIAFTLDCKNYQRIRRDVDAFGRRLGFCPNDPDYDIMISFCPLLARAGVNVIQKQIPRFWMCDPKIAMKVIEVGLTKGCHALFP